MKFKHLVLAGSVLLTFTSFGQQWNTDTQAEGSYIGNSNSGSLWMRNPSDPNTPALLYLAGPDYAKGLQIGREDGNHKILLNGVVGIGTSSPLSPLHIQSSTNKTLSLDFTEAEPNWSYTWQSLQTNSIEQWRVVGRYSDNSNLEFWNKNSEKVFTLFQNGNVGVGAANPSSQLEIEGASPVLTIDATDTGGNSEIFFDTRRDDTGSNYNTARIVADAANGYSTPTLSFYVIRGDGAGWDRTLTIKSNGLNNTGNVGIGTTNPTNKLEVNGTIRSKEVKVEATPWPDYVFEDNYELRSLEETEAYIKENKHLPEIPSAKEIEANGVALGEMNRLLLQKIEELTLHQIEMMKIIKKQQEEIEILKSE